MPFPLFFFKCQFCQLHIPFIQPVNSTPPISKSTTQLSANFHSRPVPTCRKTKNPGTRTCLLTNPNSRKYLVFYTFSVRLRHADSLRKQAFYAHPRHSPYSPLTEYVPSEQAHGRNSSAVLHGSLLTRDINTTLSTCPVWQNISTVCIFPAVYPLSANILISLASVAGSQET